MTSEQLLEWFNAHPEVCCMLCESAFATTLLEVWTRCPGIRIHNLDEGTPICEGCLPFALHVPNWPWENEPVQ